MTCLEFSKSEKTKAFSSSLDGYVKIWDLQKTDLSIGFKWNDKFDTLEDRPVKSFAQKNANELIVCHDNGKLSLIDLRQAGTAAAIVEHDLLSNTTHENLMVERVTVSENGQWGIFERSDQLLLYDFRKMKPTDVFTDFEVCVATNGSCWARDLTEPNVINMVYSEQFRNVPTELINIVIKYGKMFEKAHVERIIPSPFKENAILAYNVEPGNNVSIISLDEPVLTDPTEDKVSVVYGNDNISCLKTGIQDSNLQMVGNSASKSLLLYDATNLTLMRNN